MGGAPASAPTVLSIGSDADLIRVRRAAREAAVRAGMSLAEQTRVITASSELARNTLVHGGGGRVEISDVTRPGRRGVRMVFADEGPGIPDVARALTDGFSTGTGLGLGLGGARRLVEEFGVDSRPGRGTTVTIVSWSRNPT
ncbi:ATP-binding protein [Actinomadura kijaniata]|uniref:Serine/threonine-protein kinase RsbT n=1 Tax=Actinomadura namibiensis TaxID=182080 RepID=A0A7W3LIJ0_ACTNM|nr:ATP-binding protein [Actinomadura namibiensis]MBA8948750.1 serine/threonine-protein kinase RsbT [Actinomadura namibiensis]